MVALVFGKVVSYFHVVVLMFCYCLFFILLIFIMLIWAYVSEKNVELN